MSSPMVHLSLHPDEAVAVAAALEDVAHSIAGDRPEAYGERAKALRLHATILDALETHAKASEPLAGAFGGRSGERVAAWGDPPPLRGMTDPPPRFTRASDPGTPER